MPSPTISPDGLGPNSKKSKVKKANTLKRGEAPKGKGKGKGAGKGAGKSTGKADGKGAGKAAGKGKRQAEGLPAGPDGNVYRDRAKERRELKGEYERVAEEFNNHGELSLEESKYLGGDLDHTHLVKGLDYALLTKVRTELTKQQKADEIHTVRLQKKSGQKQQREFQNELAKKVWKTVVENLHPHHSTFKQRMERMGQALSLGQKMRGAPSFFLPGRMCYEFDTVEGQSKSKEDTPRIVYISKEDAPSVDSSRQVAPVLQDTISKVRESFQRAAEERKQRKKDKAQRAEPSFAVAQKVSATPTAVLRHKAKDTGDDNDIFQGAGGFDTTELARKSKEKAVSSTKAASRSSSYFADAGAERYRQAPEGQKELAEVEVEEHAEKTQDGIEASEAAAAFEAAERYVGSKAGWVFKLGPLGLGYYMDKADPRAQKKQAKAKASGTATGEASSTRGRGRAPRGGVPENDDDAYGECFPSAGLGHALMQTGEADSDDEGDEDKKKKDKAGKKKDDGQGSTIAANQKNEAKRKKRSEVQEWQKIDSMINKGKHSSLDELEAHAARQSRKQPPMPREIMSTPAYF